MAYIKLVGKRDVDATEDVNEKLLSDVDYTRVAAWAAAKYLPQGVLVPGDPQADPPVPDSYRQPTGDEIFHALTEAVYIDIKTKVEQWYLAQAEAAARASVQPIVLNPAE